MTESTTTTKVISEVAKEEVVKEEIKEESPQDKLHKRIGEILNEHGGESNIPTAHEYWDLLNKLRALRNP